jgi:hypothetical protein
VIASEDLELVQATERLIRQAQEIVPYYGVGFGGVGLNGSSTRDVSALCAATSTRIKERRLHGIVTGIAVPSAVGPKIIIDPARPRGDREFTVRHELGHIFAGEVVQALFLTSEDTMSFSERRADLFAVTDLTPTRWLEWLRGGRRRWKLLELEVKQAFRELTDGWSEQRLNDRAQLRVLLYRKHGI